MTFSQNEWYERLRFSVDEVVTRFRRHSSDSKSVKHGFTNRHERTRLRLGVLEPRLLFSATPIDPAVMGDDGQGSATVLLVDAEESQVSESSSAASIAQNASGELIVIDGNVPELQSLLDDLSQSRPDAEVFVLDPTRDGVQQITELLDSQSDLSSLHIVSHGQDSAIRLGNVWLGNDNLSAYAGEIAQWQSAFSSDADILFYGCDLAADADGRDFLESMQALTDADIAASDDITGHQSLGGDWDLEYLAGSIETEVAFSIQLQADWQHTLPGVIIDVTTFSDVDDAGDGVTSFREAVAQAVAGDTINLGFLGEGTFGQTEGTIEIDKDLTIVGLDSRSTIIDGSGQSGQRLLHTSSDAVVTISNVTLQGGDESNGGAIFVDDTSTLFLSDATLRSNSSNSGGAIHVHATAHLNRVLMTGNTASGDGGAIHFHSDGNGSLTNVTISGNTSVGDGGGVFVDTSATVTITNSTITENDADNGGGIGNGNGTVAIQNTIVAGNTTGNANKDVVGAFSSDGSNLFGVVTGSSGLNADTVSSSIGLLALGNYGGQTDTHALQEGSIAIDAGSFSGAPSVDARGVSRDSQRDIGAFEATSSLFWLSTRDNSDAPSDAPGLDSWTNGEVLQLSDPNLQLGSGGTDGTFSSTFDLEIFADDNDLDIDGLHYVTQNITLGTTTTIDLQPGDLLISTRENESFDSGAFSVFARDIFLFRPDSPGDYSSGSFASVLSRLDLLADTDLAGLTNIWSFSLVEQNTTVGDATLSAGDFLFTRAGVPAEENDVYVFHTIDVGNGTTDGTADVLIEGDDVGITSIINGLELVETTTTMGGETVNAGDLLMTLGTSNSSIGTGGITVDRQDVFRLQVSDTTLVAGTAVADAVVLLDGSSLGLDTNQEDLNALAIIPSSAPAARMTIAYEGFDYSAGSLNGENGGSGWASGWTLNSGGSAQVNSAGLTAPTGLQEGVGGTLEMNTSSQFEQRRELSTTLGADGTTAWFSFLLKPDGTGSGGISLLIGDGDGADNTVNVGTAGNDFLVGVDASASGVKIDNVVVDAQTYLLVVQIDFEAGDDTVTLYVDPTPGISTPDSPGSMTTQLTSADLGTFTRLAIIGGFSGNNSNIDEIRVGTSFQHVAPPSLNTSPTDISLVSSSVDENTDTNGGYSVGVLSGLDPDTNESFTWQVVGGADVSHFSIGGASSNELILDDSVLDYETQSSYEVTVRVTDSASNTYDETLTINVNDENDVAPVIDDSQVFTVAEDASDTTPLGFVAATDPDTLGTLTNWTITGGNTDSIFGINESTGELTVANRTDLDFENVSSYSLSIQVEDGLNQSANQTVQINVVDVAEVNALWFSTSFDVTNSQNPDLTQWDEDQVVQLGDPNLSFDPSGSATNGTLSLPGFKISDFHSSASARIEGMHAVWSNLTIGDPGNQFDLLAGDLLLTLARDGVTLNSETEPDKTFDMNDIFVFRPTATGDYSDGNFFHLLEDPLASGRIRGISLVESTAGVTVGDTHLTQGTFLLARDGIDEQDRIYTYNATSVGSGNTIGASQILLEGDSTTETINGGNLDFAERIDGIHIVDSNRTIGGTNLLAGDLLISTYNVPSIATVSVADQDITLLRMATTRIGDDHSTGTAQLLLDASDIEMEPGDVSEDIDALTLVEFAIDNPAIGAISDTNATTNAVAENAASGTIVGVTANATDTGDTVVYSLDNNADDRFQIDGGTGVVTVLNALDFEAAQSHEIVARATSSDTSTRTLAFTIQITDVNEAPSVSLSSNTGTIAENADTTAATTLATITVNDDALGSESLQLSGTDMGLFEIVSGELRLRSGVALDFETKPTLQVTVEVDDNTVGSSPDDSKVFTLTVSDANDAPTVSLSTNSGSIAEDANTTAATTLAAITISDDALGSESLQLSGTDMGLFEIVGGDLRLRSGVTLDFETKPTIQVTVEVDDNTVGGSPDDSQTFTLTVSNANDAPTVSLSTNSESIAENADTTAATTLAAITVNDDALGSESLGLSGADMGLFEIVSGELRLRAGVTLDFETKPTIQVTVEVDDNTVGGSPDDSQIFTLTVQNRNDAAVGLPVIQGTTTEGDTLSVDTSGISDEDGLGAFEYQWFRSGTIITGAINSSYMLTSLDANETIQVAVRFTDGQANTEGPLTSVATASITRLNQAPTLDNYETTATAGTAKTVPRLVFNSLSDDPDGDPLTAVLVTPPPVGTLDLQPNGRFTYTPEDGFVGRVVFQWQASDWSLSSAPATVTIDVIRAQVPITLPPSNRVAIDPVSSGNTSSTESDSGDESADEAENTESPDETGSDAEENPNATQSKRESQEKNQEATSSSTSNAVVTVVANQETSGEQAAATSPAVAAIESASESNSNRPGRNSQTSQGPNSSDSSDVTRLDSRGQSVQWEDMVMLTRPGAMWDELDQRQKGVESLIQGDLIVVGSAGAAASSFTVGAVAWAMRSGFLVSGLIAHMPAWSGVDPLMVMQGLGDGAEGSTETLEELMDRQAKAMESEDTSQGEHS